MMYNVRTKLLSLDKDIFITELCFSLNFYLPYHSAHSLLTTPSSEISNQFLTELIIFNRLYSNSLLQ